MELQKTIPDYYQISQEEFTKTKSLAYISIECQCCKNIFNTTKKNVLSGLTARGEFVSYCSARCSNQIRSRNSRKDVTCKECSKVFSKTLSEIKKSENHFCSRSCANSFNNKVFVKRKLTRTCLKCDDIVFTYRHNHCEKHHREYKTNKYLNKTLRRIS